MTDKLDKIKTALEHIEWGESVLHEINDGDSLHHIELVFLDRNNKEILQFPYKDRLNRKRMSVPLGLIEDMLNKELQRLHEEINFWMGEYMRGKNEQTTNDHHD